ncbi:hypothetical protein NEUTE1DRAFT_37544 [Neurospora tetrasperma FGSC 2508]|uniref:Uncharacterized protein n=1 Tax=Neurospora tetrasperma (strain FGSC 2508 / ATCC MYA-4615 / P0657) TaxID=510951 RepID=F8MCP3_NEUT8|nr:uncharacterized protein NEUTE1DRAFT_37544 [Neurospora tetrasperma FGSC 2508]EGO60490.1 hypothetical protein NEUTE1DRAFT_37544 [Neurospora tetrasperma FGSC 2508]EGZ75536.1 hypothetical protein NEUTE2DRAFT_55330 [Neurospora tetrasperma FGSC 2509]
MCHYGFLANGKSKGFGVKSARSSVFLCFARVSIHSVIIRAMVHDSRAQCNGIQKWSTGKLKQARKLVCLQPATAILKIEAK